MSYEDREDYQATQGTGLTVLEWIGCAALATLALAAYIGLAVLVG